MRRLNVQCLGRVSYAEGLDLQRQIWEQRLADEVPDTLLLLEHESVFTMGRRDTWQDLLLPEEQLSAPLVRTDRGGEVTYHGPGQLVGYFHAKLKQLDAVSGYSKMSSSQENMGIGIKELVYGLEESIILLLRKEYGLEAWRDMQHRGVWLGERVEGQESSEEGYCGDLSGFARKIAAVGISVKKGVSMHGFALNLTTDLHFFKEIVPCGIVGRGVTSLACEWGTAVGKGFVTLVAEQLCAYFCYVFGYDQVGK